MGNSSVCAEIQYFENENYECGECVLIHAGLSSLYEVGLVPNTTLSLKLNSVFNFFFFCCENI